MRVFTLHSVFVFLMLLAGIKSGFAQTPDTVSLISVDIVSKKEKTTEVGKRREVLDSVLITQHHMHSLSEALAAGTGIFIKSYGPGAVSSSALRGGNASHTAFVWNGFNLQNTMLGQTDVSLLPVAFFDEVQVDYGAAAASWGSGAVGGAIHLKDNNKIVKGINGLISAGMGSFGRRFLSGRLTLGNGRFSSVTRFYGNQSENNFTYTDSLAGDHQTKTMQRAAYRMAGVMQQVKWLVGKRSVVNVNGWLNGAERQLPGFGNNLETKTRQTDAALRLTADYKFVSTRWTSIYKAAFFDEKMNYEDSLALNFTHNKLKTLMLEAENYYRWNENHESGVFLLTNHSFGNTEYYSTDRQFSRSGIVLTHHLKLFAQRLRVSGQVRAEYFSAGALPVTWNLGTTFQATESLRFLLNGGSVYRQPTLNELYWTPGGNQNLKPEEGHAFEASMEYTKKMRVFEFSAAGSLFHRDLQNWILWVPGPGANPEARNLQQVWSRGTDSKISLLYKRKKFQAGLIANTSYVLSTVKQIGLENDGSLNRQLPYTPRYIFTGRAHLAYSRLGVLVSQQYGGYRFTTSDNSQWLKPYWTTSVRVSYDIPLNKQSFSFFAAVFNLADQPYSVMAGRPMPGRNYEGGLTIKFK